MNLIRGDIDEDSYFANMELRDGRPLRKKERDELDMRIKQLKLKQPELMPQVIYPVGKDMS